MLFISLPSQIDLIWCPVQCGFFLGPPPPHIPSCTHTRSLISHVLVLNFSKGDSFVFSKLARQSKLCCGDVSHAATLPHSKASKSQEKHFRMQSSKQPHWQCHKIFHYPDTHEQIKYQVCSLHPAYVTWWSGWAQPAAENIFTGIRNEKRKKLKKLEKLAYPLKSLLVGLSLSTCICGTLQTACVRLKWGQHS